MAVAIQKADTAVVFIDPQNDVLSEKGANWGAVGASAPALGDGLGDNRPIATVPGGGYCFIFPLGLAEEPAVAPPQCPRHRLFFEVSCRFCRSDRPLWSCLGRRLRSDL
jgi:hypothetical protein